jgi:hypothetical protein
MLIVLVWIICGACCPLVSHRKGRPVIVGLLAGLFLGPLGLIVVALTPPNWAIVCRCPACRQINERFHPRCRACGTALAAD